MHMQATVCLKVKIHVIRRLRCAYLHLQCSFTEHRNMKVVYRRYASLFFLVGIDDEEVSPMLHWVT